MSLIQFIDRSAPFGFLGAGDPSIDALLGPLEPSGLGLDFLSQKAVRRWAADPQAQYEGPIGDLPGFTFSRASAATRINAAGAYESVGNNVLRVDHDPVTLAQRGALFEGSDTNYCPNNSMQGGVAGSPGIQPTGWNMTASGLNDVIRTLSYTTQDGIDCIDIKVSGTPTNTHYLEVRPTGLITASAGQTWNFGAFMSLLAGSLTNFVSVRLYITFYNSSLSELATRNPIIIPTEPGRLSGKFLTPGSLVAPANTAYVSGYFAIYYTAGQPIDVTLRFGWPQLVRGTRFGSPIRTTGSAVTRAADALSIPVSSFPFSATQGTLFVDGFGSDPTGTAWYLLALNDGSTANFAGVAAGAVDGGSVRLAVFSASSPQAAATLSGRGLSNVRTALSWQVNDFAWCANGGAVGADTSGSVPSGLTNLSIGGLPAGQRVLNGYIRRIAYIPRRLSNAELQGITA